MPLFQQLPKASSTPSSRIYVEMSTECGKLLNHVMCKLFLEEPGVNRSARERKVGRMMGKASSCVNPDYTTQVKRPRPVGAPRKVPAAL